jgi:hypothetical protein
VPLGDSQAAQGLMTVVQEARRYAKALLACGSMVLLLLLEGMFCPAGQNIPSKGKEIRRLRKF